MCIYRLCVFTKNKNENENKNICVIQKGMYILNQLTEEIKIFYFFAIILYLHHFPLRFLSLINFPMCLPTLFKIHGFFLH